MSATDFALAVPPEVAGTQDQATVLEATSAASSATAPALNGNGRGRGRS